MAWVNQHYEYNDLSALIAEKHVELELKWRGCNGMTESRIELYPSVEDEAKAFALILRKAAKRLEQISVDLP